MTAAAGTARLRPLRILFLSTPVGPLGSGQGGGVELTLQNLARILSQRGHAVRVVAPAGSVLAEAPLHEVGGVVQPAAQRRDRAAPVEMPANSVLAAIWEHARCLQRDYDVLLNFAYDWLPFYLTPFLDRPVGHFVSMASLSDAMDGMIGDIATRFPGTVAAYTRAQAVTFPAGNDWPVLGSGVDLARYAFTPAPGPWLAWVGRVSPEKGLEDAVAAARDAGSPLRVLGEIQDAAYWARVLQAHPGAAVEYLGFLPTEELARELGRCRALLVTPRWVEAFGNVAIEALACGVPVVAYRRGGPAEIVRHGLTGWLVEPDSVAGLLDAIRQLHHLDRAACRRQAEAEYSLDAFGGRVEAWLAGLVGRA